MHRTLSIKVHTVGNDLCASKSPLPPSLWRNSTSYTAHIVNLDDNTACANGSFNCNLSETKKQKKHRKRLPLTCYIMHFLHQWWPLSVMALSYTLCVGRLVRELNIVTVCFGLFFLSAYSCICCVALTRCNYRLTYSSSLGCKQINQIDHIFVVETCLPGLKSSPPENLSLTSPDISLFYWVTAWVASVFEVSDRADELCYSLFFFTPSFCEL